MPVSKGSPAFVALVQASAGAAGGVFASFLLMPIEVAKTRIQIGASKTESTAGAMAEILNLEGAAGLFRGVGAKCSETGARNFVYFYIYDAFNEYIKRRAKATAFVKLALGYLAGVYTTMATMPLEVLSTKLQAGTVKGKSLVAALRHVLADEGVTGLFKGFWFNMALCINPAIANSVFDRIKEILLKIRKQRGEKRPALTPLQAFFLGALAKAIATLVTFPLVRMKTILQAGASDPDAKKSNGSIVSSESVLSRVVSLYQGLSSTLWKSVLQAALLYMTKDQVEQLVIFLFRLSTKMMRRRDGRLKLGATSGRPLV